MKDNLRGILLMVVAMATFTLADTFLKLVSQHMPVGQVIACLGAGGATIFGLLSLRAGRRVWAPEAMHPTVLLRGLGEVTGTLGFIFALALIPFSTASAILQATPLAVTLGAALFLGEQVGWRRWSAILVGFFGVLVILRPGMEGFQPASLWAVLAVVGLALRDVVTRLVPRTTSSLQLSVWGMAVLVPTGLLLLPAGPPPTMPAPLVWAQMGGAVVMAAAGYYAIIAAMRLGEVAVVTPFRYTRILFALFIGVLVFDETLDTPMLVGAALIVGSGLYTFWRERRLGLARRPLSPPPTTG